MTLFHWLLSTNKIKKYKGLLIEGGLFSIRKINFARKAGKMNFARKAGKMNFARKAGKMNFARKAGKMNFARKAC